VWGGRGDEICGEALAGARSVWIRRGQVWSDADFHPTLMADGAAEAVGLILAADVRAGSVQST